MVSALAGEALADDLDVLVDQDGHHLDLALMSKPQGREDGRRKRDLRQNCNEEAERTRKQKGP